MKLQVPFVQLPLQFDADRLAREMRALGSDPWREHPQKFPGNFALPLISAHGDPDSNATAGPMRPTAYLEQCPYLMQVLARLGAVWGRTRLMKLSGQAEVTPHADINYYWRERVRVHVPILTWPTVRFLCGDAEVNMKAGECWIFDTWREHRVINGADDERVHLVADTTGSPAFWDLVNRGRAPGRAAAPEWRTDFVPALAGPDTLPRYEGTNAPDVMTPWELREHMQFLLRDIVPHPGIPAVQQHAAGFLTHWHALWAEHGAGRSAWPLYRSLLEEFENAVEPATDQMLLVNGSIFFQALRAMITTVALADRRMAKLGPSHAQQPGA